MKNGDVESVGLDSGYGYVLQPVDGVGWEVIAYYDGVEVGGAFYAGKDAYMVCKELAVGWVGLRQPCARQRH